jgi:NADH dehydrogenase
LEVTLLDRRNFHLFQPLLYQVATGGLSPANIAAPLRALLKRQRNARVLLGEVTDFDLGRRLVLLEDGGQVAYDSLIVAAGVRHAYFGNDAWEVLAPGPKTIEDATEIRRRVLLAFEAAERACAGGEGDAWLTFVIVGGGPTGVELAGALAEIARDTLRRDFRCIDPAAATILLIEGAERVLPTYPPELSAKAGRYLEKLGVTVRTETRVTAIRDGAVDLVSGGRLETVFCRTVLWGAGILGSPLGARLAGASGCELDGAGRVRVAPDCSLPGHPEVFVVGDLARFEHGGPPLPGVAQVAIQQGRFVARTIAARARGRARGATFRYRDYGNLATVGRAAAVADIGRFRFGGTLAWLTWLFVHLMSLVMFQNRLLVLVQWAWAYFTFNRAARLITGHPLLPETPAGRSVQGRAENPSETRNGGG